MSKSALKDSTGGLEESGKEGEGGTGPHKLLRSQLISKRSRTGILGT